MATLSIHIREVNAADMIEVLQTMANKSYIQARSLLITASGIFDHGIAKAIVTCH